MTSSSQIHNSRFKKRHILKVIKEKFSKILFYNIQKDKKSMRQLKKLRWYQIMDEDNFFI